MRVAFHTLGCKVNLNETGAMEQIFIQNGFELVPETEQADVYIINSCTVTNYGDQKSRKWLRKVKREHPDAITVLTGCYPQAFPEDAAKVIEADLVCGNTQRSIILPYVKQLLAGHERIVAISPHGRNDIFEELPIEHFEGHTRAFIKIEDGCDRQCAYCVIPRARGSVRSRAENSILNELHTLAQSGYKEVVLSAISLPSYGKDTNTDLITLLEKIENINGIERIRLGSIDPDMLNDDTILRMSKLKKLCPQFHLSLQSGCTKTLKRMNRKYTAEQYLEVVEKLKKAFGLGSISFTTDCICGFPAETQEDFEESCAFIETVGFLKVHVFPYSRRNGTAAYGFAGQLCERDKTLRSKEMSIIAEKVRATQIAKLEGTIDDMLLEQKDKDGYFSGYTKLYVPVKVLAPKGKKGDIVCVRLGKYDGDKVLGEIVNFNSSITKSI